MKKQIRLLATVLLLAVLCTMSFTSCTWLRDLFDPQPTEPVRPTLTTPILTLNADNSVTWEAVEGATGYVVNVNGSDLNTTTSTSFAAMNAAGTYTIKVLATDGENRTEYSEAVSYSIIAVSLPTSELYTITGETLVKGGSDYTFTFTLAEGVMGTPVVKANGKALTGVDGKYTIEAISENTTITVEGLKKQGVFNVTIPTGFGYTVTGADSILEGEDYVFELKVSDSCTQSVPVVKVNGEILVVGADGKYTVSNVAQDLVITVEGIEINTYTVTLPSGTGFTVEGALEIEEGADYTFKVVLSEGYSKSELVVKVDGEVISAIDGVYRVVAPNRNLNIIVEGVTLNTYTVRLPESSDQYTISVSGNQTLNHGSSITFSITLLDKNGVLLVKANGQAVNAVDGVYTLDNIADDIEVTVAVSSIADQLLVGSTWGGAVAGEGDGTSIEVWNGASLSPDFVKMAWEAGYTHLVFKYTSESTSGSYIHTSTAEGGWMKYWDSIGDKSGRDIRIDLSEFVDGDTYYGIRFQDLNANFVVSEPRLYKSQETLDHFTKSDSNMYFAKEGDFYVLETRGNMYVYSSAEWLKTYMPGNKNEISVYGDVIYGSGFAVGTGGLWHAKPADSNYWLSDQGSAWNENLHFYIGTNGQGAVVAKFKAGATVEYTAQNGNNLDVTIDTQDKYEAILTVKDSGSKLYLTEILERWIAQGVEKVHLTMTGTGLSGAVIWVGDGNDWFDKPVGETDTDKRITKMIDLTKLTEGENFYLLISGTPVSNMTVTLVKDGDQGPIPEPPVEETKYTVSVPAGEGYTVSGETSKTVLEGESVSFTISANNSGDILTVKNGDTIIEGAEGVYTITNVSSNITLTVEVKAPAVTTEEELKNEFYTPGTWGNAAVNPVAGTSLEVWNGATLQPAFIQKLIENGYTHLVFTFTSETTAGSFIHSGQWDKYWDGVADKNGKDLRFDLTEFVENGTYYGIKFQDMTANFTVTNVRIFKSQETIDNFTKSSTNMYFAKEGDFYVIETRGNMHVYSSAEWIKAYMPGNKNEMSVYGEMIKGNGFEVGVGGLWHAKPADSNYWLSDQGSAWNENMHFYIGTNTQGAIVAKFKLGTTIEYTAQNGNTLNVTTDTQEKYVAILTVKDTGTKVYLTEILERWRAEGKTEVLLTMTGSDLGGAAIWVGDGNDWFDKPAGESDTDERITKLIDLTKISESENFYLFISGSAVSDMQITLEEYVK